MWEYSKSELTGEFVIRCDGETVARTGSEAVARRIVESCRAADRQATEASVKGRTISQDDAPAE